MNGLAREGQPVVFSRRLPVVPSAADFRSGRIGAIVLSQPKLSSIRFRFLWLDPITTVPRDRRNDRAATAAGVLSVAGSLAGPGDGTGQHRSPPSQARTSHLRANARSTTAFADRSTSETGFPRGIRTTPAASRAPPAWNGDASSSSGMRISGAASGERHSGAEVIWPDGGQPQADAGAERKAECLRHLSGEPDQM